MTKHFPHKFPSIKELSQCEERCKALEREVRKLKRLLRKSELKERIDWEAPDRQYP